jgi:hypothetical protein
LHGNHSLIYSFLAVPKRTQRKSKAVFHGLRRFHRFIDQDQKRINHRGHGGEKINIKTSAIPTKLNHACEGRHLVELNYSGLNDSRLRIKV